MSVWAGPTATAVAPLGDTEEGRVGCRGLWFFLVMGGPDATRPTSQSITASVEAGSRGSGGRNFSPGRHGSRCAPVIHAYHLRWPNHLPKPACPRETTPHSIEAQWARVGR